MPQPNDKNIQLSRNTLSLPAWTHPEVQYWMPEWEKIRDSFVGTRQIKDKGVEYLPKLDGMTDDEYKTYKRNAVFFNMVARTVTGLTGTLFRRAPVVENLPSDISTDSLSKDGEDLFIFAKSLAQEIVTVGRHGVLVDMAPDAERPEPYLCGYIAENILDWEYRTVRGKNVLSRVVLREINIVRSPTALGVFSEQNATRVNPASFQTASRAGTSGTIAGGNRQYFAAYRVLELVEQEDGSMIYQQQVFRNDNGHADLINTVPEIVIPVRRGEPLDFIPFVFFGPYSNTPGIEKPPVLDITDINISHYNSYAHLEQGRFYTGLPIYFVPVSNADDGGEYTIGPSVVWETVPGDRPGIIEFNGHGLRFLESALDQKEQQAASLGGRMLGVRPIATSESDNQVALNEKNEQSLLLNVSNTMDAGLSKLLAWYAWWQDVPMETATEITVEINKDFLLNIGARELRAVQAMYKDGLIPVDVLFDYLRKAEVVPDFMQIDEFKRMLEQASSFPGQPDVHARQEGIPDAKTALELEKEQREREEREIRDRQVDELLRNPDLQNLMNMRRQEIQQQGQPTPPSRPSQEE